MQYQFDQFTIDTQNLWLRQGDTDVVMGEKELALLALLIESRAETLTHEMLLARLWPGRVVTQQSVARLVADARKSLRQAGLKGPVIETCHGRGYRLAVPLVRRLAPVKGSDEQPAAISRRYSLWLALPLVLVVAALVWWFRPEPTPLLFSEPQAVQGRILWVDDNPENNQREADYLRNLGLGVHQVRESADVHTLLAIYHFDVLISDMGRNNNPVAGLELLDALRADGHSIPVVFYTLVVNPPFLAEVEARGGQGAADSPERLYQQIDAFIPTSTGAR